MYIRDDICVDQEHTTLSYRARLNESRTRLLCFQSLWRAHHVWAFFDKPSRTVVNTHQEMANRNKRQCRALIRRLQGTLMRLYCADRHLSVESRSLSLPAPLPSPPSPPQPPPFLNPRRACARVSTPSAPLAVVLWSVGIGSGLVGCRMDIVGACCAS